MNREQEIIDSWQENAANWINVIGREGILSRKLATNQAIISAVMGQHPATLLDIGCGEGWLCAAVASRGVKVTGIDVIPELVDKASREVPGEFRVASYEEIARGNVPFDRKFDVIVINFALIGKESTEELLQALPALLEPNGRLFIQTLHPYSRKPLDDYKSGWKSGSWDGLDGPFTRPYEWYFRTLEDWLDLLTRCGFTKTWFTEPLHPQTRQPLSVIFSSKAN